jgi:tRNA(Arg) A34 adenosine deaminase TadA
MTKKPRRQFKLKATIFNKKGHAISKGENSYSKTHPLQGRLAKEAGRPDAIFLHAEIAALIKLKNWDDAHRIYIERYSDIGEPVPAKPCEICLLALKKAGIKVIHHT